MTPPDPLPGCPPPDIPFGHIRAAPRCRALHARSFRNSSNTVRPDRKPPSGWNDRSDACPSRSVSVSSGPACRPHRHRRTARYWEPRSRSPPSRPARWPGRRSPAPRRCPAPGRTPSTCPPSRPRPYLPGSISGPPPPEPPSMRARGNSSPRKPKPARAHPRRYSSDSRSSAPRQTTSPPTPDKPQRRHRRQLGMRN